MKTLKQLNKFIVTEFKIGLVEKELLDSRNGKCTLDKAIEPSEFIGKTLSNHTSGKLVDSEELKSAAIEWIKEFQKERTDAISEMFDNVDKNGIYPTTIFFNRIDKFWMDKFNISEEDLKCL